MSAAPDMTTGPVRVFIATTAGWVGFGRTFLVIVYRPERTFLGTTFALGTALKEKVRKGHVTGARMNGNSTIDRFEALNGL